MVKSCSAVGCEERAVKGSGVHFYCFPADPERRTKWIAAVRRKNWTPGKNSWLCSPHFIGERNRIRSITGNSVQS